MKISQKYQKALDNYLIWSRCTTPESRCAWAPRARFDEAADGTSAAEAMFRFETYGEKKALKFCREPMVLKKYCMGKANRDWWTKDKGWWDKHAAYQAEEFCGHLVPECFAELFGHWPRTHLVRWLHDNNYTEEMLDRDIDFRLKGLERIQDGVEII